MSLEKLTEQDRSLMDMAADLIAKRRSKWSGVAAALRTSNEKVFQGVNIEVEASAPCSICAEYAAIGTMVTDGENTIHTIVAVNYKGQVIPPCGKCRQFIGEFGNPYVIIKTNDGVMKSRLADLYPLPVS